MTKQASEPDATQWPSSTSWTDMATVRMTYHIWCLSNSSWSQTKQLQLRAPVAERLSLFDFCDFFELILRIDSRRVTLTRTFSVFFPSDAHVTVSAHKKLSWLKVGLKSHSIKSPSCWLAFSVRDGLQLPLPRLDVLCAVLVLRWHIGIIPNCARTCAKCLAVWRYTSHPHVASPTCPTPAQTCIQTESGLFQMWM